MQGRQSMENAGGEGEGEGNTQGRSLGLVQLSRGRAAEEESFPFGGLQSGYRKQVRHRPLSKMQAEDSKWLGADGSKLAGQCWHARIMQEQPNLLGADWRRRR